MKACTIVSTMTIVLPYRVVVEVLWISDTSTVLQTDHSDVSSPSVRSEIHLHACRQMIFDFDTHRQRISIEPNLRHQIMKTAAFFVFVLASVSVSCKQFQRRLTLSTIHETHFGPRVDARPLLLLFRPAVKRPHWPMSCSQTEPCPSTESVVNGVASTRVIRQRPRASKPSPRWSMNSSLKSKRSAMV